MSFRATSAAIATAMIALVGLLPAVARAETSPDDAPSSAPQPKLHFVDGPKTIDLGHSVTLNLPAQHRYLGHDESDKLLRSGGNLHNENVLGIVAPREDEGGWFAVIDWSGEEGHIKDDEKVDADDLLKELREGQKEANEERKQQGFDELTLDGWQVPPAYDKAKHHLSWALIVGGKEGKSVNFNTRILGRTSYVAIDLVTDPAKLDSFRSEAMVLLDATGFVKGQRYEDFDSGKDKVAEYGLAGLIAGGAGLAALKFAKVGLLAKLFKPILAILIAAKKAVVVAFVAIGAWLKKLFGGKEKQPQLAQTNAPPPNDSTGPSDV